LAVGPISKINAEPKKLQATAKSFKSLKANLNIGGSAAPSPPADFLSYQTT
jgi:hypothetical protein